MNILTFDIEEWWGYDHYSIGKKKDWLPRLDNYLDEILALLEVMNIKATFFCLGEVANSYPNVIKKIASKGHHIGCHSFSHRFLGDASPKEVAEDTYKALDVIENIIGVKVTAYRAPAFSITEKNKWILGILAENGILYDCSIFPAKRSFGGFSCFDENSPSIIDYQGKLIKEFPISVTKIFGYKMAYSGGGYFRLFPYTKIKSIIQESDYVMTYFHLKDFDREQVRKYHTFQGESATARYIKDYYGLKGNFLAFKKLLSDFNFISVEEAAVQVNWTNASIIKF